MPIYEYECEKCRRVLNFLVRNAKVHKPPACPKCGHKKMHRVLSRFAAVKKGAGPGHEASRDAALPAIPAPKACRICPCWKVWMKTILGRWTGDAQAGRRKR